MTAQQQAVLATLRLGGAWTGENLRLHLSARPDNTVTTVRVAETVATALETAGLADRIRGTNPPKWRIARAARH